MTHLDKNIIVEEIDRGASNSTIQFEEVFTPIQQADLQERREAIQMVLEEIKDYDVSTIVQNTWHLFQQAQKNGCNLEKSQKKESQWDLIVDKVI